jgi:hypothetical protein
MRCVLKMIRLAPGAEVDDGVLERLRVDRVEAAERLVEDHEIGVVQQRADELHLLLHAARQLVDLRRAPVLLGRLEREPLEPRVDAAVGVLAADPLQFGEEAQHLAHLHLLVEPALLGQVADAIGDAGVGVGTPEDADRALVGAITFRIMRIVVVLPAPLGPSRP